MTNILADKKLEEGFKEEYTGIKRSFAQTRENFQRIIDTKKVWQKKYTKSKLKLEKINKEIENEDIEDISEKDFIKYYLKELMALKNSKNEDPLF
mmetsp:Transcript_29128/g.26538  ORF Transcript_29128/g.26538 Transcript_29128/m.26538 type:complete len:95 (-) Transcript_29128:167-451(-)